MVNTDMWHHPNYYKKLRASLVKKSDQAISDGASTEATSVRPGPGQSSKRQAATGPGASCKQQAASVKQQAASLKHQAVQES